MSMANDLPTLPVDVVVNIQTFMNYRDATRSACLCQELYDSWYKRKEIDFDEGEFINHSECWRVAMETVRRYKDKDLEMEVFRVLIVSPADPSHSSAAVLEAAAKVASGILICVVDRSIAYRIPHGVFESTKLNTLAVAGGSLDLSQKLPVSCASIRHLTLYPACNNNVDNDILNNYILRLPKLEYLLCRGFLLRFDCSSIFSIVHDLYHLEVDLITSNDHFWITQFIPRFRRLRQLSLRGLPNSCKHLILYSASVENISIEDRLRTVGATLNMPSLRTFNFYGHPSSRFTFETAISGVLSKITVWPHELNEKWLGDLHSFLLVLTTSKIFLEVRRPCTQTIPDADNAFDPVGVDILDVRHMAASPSMVEVLLRVCSPRETRYNA